MGNNVKIPKKIKLNKVKNDKKTPNQQKTIGTMNGTPRLKKFRTIPAFGPTCLKSQGKTCTNPQKSTEIINKMPYIHNII